MKMFTIIKSALFIPSLKKLTESFYQIIINISLFFICIILILTIFKWIKITFSWLVARQIIVS